MALKPRFGLVLVSTTSVSLGVIVMSDWGWAGAYCKVTVAPAHVPDACSTPSPPSQVKVEPVPLLADSANAIERAMS
jgi:hypothetical protein